MDIVMHARHGVLVFNNKIWEKRVDPDFDVGMGDYDGAEETDLADLYILNLIQQENILPVGPFGLYQDDGLGVTTMSGPALERARKQLVALFKSNGLSITTNWGTTKAEFLDVVLDLNQDNFGPYSKPNTYTKYISVGYNLLSSKTYPGV